MPGSPEVLIYTRPFCGYCAAAKALLEHKGVSFHEISIQGDDAVREDMVRRTGRRTVPQVFIGERHVGGYEDLAALDEQGELDGLLGMAGEGRSGT